LVNSPKKHFQPYIGVNRMNVAWVRSHQFLQKAVVLDSGQKQQQPGCNQFQGKIANTRAGKPEPPFGFGKLTIAIAPASGT